MCMAAPMAVDDEAVSLAAHGHWREPLFSGAAVSAQGNRGGWCTPPEARGKASMLLSVRPDTTAEKSGDSPCV